ncbi:MAG: D-alanyl-D-alanine carboxypeptidase [Pyrinomonadaceae bacterium]
MKYLVSSTPRWLTFFAIASLLGVLPVLAQQKTRPPMFEDIVITDGKRPAPTPTPGIRPTGSSQPIGAAPIASNRKTSIQALAEVDIPGYSGVLVESLDGEVLLDSYGDAAFNPASNVKVATAYAVLSTFGVDYRFRTDIWTDGEVDPATGTLNGNLYVSGRDPMFNLEHGVHLAHELNAMGVNKIEGDLIVTDNFAMNYSASSKQSGYLLQRTLDGTKRTNAAASAWAKHRINTGKVVSTQAIPSVSVGGDLYVESIPTNARLLLSHESTPLKEIVKVTMSYSNNFLAERLGDMLGGAYGVSRKVHNDAGVSPGEFSLQTCSGLGINRVTPRAQIRLLRTFRSFLQKNRMSFTDVMPVAGIDDGTLKGRYNDAFNIGSVVGKTGTLPRTDSGVSTLSGQVTTRTGTYLFVIFNQRGSVGRFRSFQNSFVPLLQNVLGGAVKMPYVPVSMDKRLAHTRILYPDGRRSRTED